MQIQTLASLYWGTFMCSTIEFPPLSLAIRPTCSGSQTPANVVHPCFSDHSVWWRWTWWPRRAESWRCPPAWRQLRNRCKSKTNFHMNQKCLVHTAHLKVWYNNVHLKVWYNNVHLKVWYNNVHLKVWYSTARDEFLVARLLCLDAGRGDVRLMKWVMFDIPKLVTF